MDPSVHHFVLNAMLLVLMVVRYVWGPLNDFVRLGLVLTLFWAAGSDLDLYLSWPVPFQHIDPGSRSLIGKVLFMIFLIADLVKDFLQWRHRVYVRDLVGYVKNAKKAK